MARWDRDDESSIPAWFWNAVETTSRESSTIVDECDVLYRSWSDHGDVDILLLHGMYAHSRWWDFIAPLLPVEYRVVAMDFTGMGDSDHRYEYSTETYVSEILQVADAAGLDESTILVGHSFGGRMATNAINLAPDRFSGLVLVDSGIGDPSEEDPDYLSAMGGGGPAKAYPNREVAESRFRLFPPQPCENEYLVQYIARHSIEALPGGGYSWKFDPDFPSIFRDRPSDPLDFESLTIPVALIYGEESKSHSAAANRYTMSLIPKPARTTAIAGAQHHVFLDQPKAFVEELKLSLEWIQSQLSNTS